jgi:hypothetical protein
MLNSLIGIIASSGGAAAVPNSYESIATTTVGSGGAASVTFSSIPSTYQHLQIRLIARSDRNQIDTLTDYLEMNFNSDTGANYAYHQLLGDGSTASSNAGTSDNYIIVSRISTTTAGASMFGGIVIDILDYANTSKYKTTRSLGGTDQNGSGRIYFNSGLWQSTAATSTIRLKPSSSNNFLQYSQIALYGIKG